MDPEAVSSGVAGLDEALGGLLWGDNIVWEVEEGGSAEPFFRALARTASSFDFAGFVTLTRPPEEVVTLYPGVRVLDARPGRQLAQPGPLLTEIRRTCSASARELLLFDPLEAMAAQWGAETARRFFVRTCPLLLELGAIAYWSLATGLHARALRDDIAQIAQCVFAVGPSLLRIARAEGRPAGLQGALFRLEGAGEPAIAPAPLTARLGGALRALRDRYGLTQTELARLAGISPSAISQAERGQRGLSLETMLELSDRLGVTLDELLRGHASSGYRIARRLDPHRRAEARPLALLDDPEAGLRALVLRLPGRSSAIPDVAHEGVQLLALSGGLVQLVLTTGTPVLRDREALLIERGNAVEAIRNLSEREATLFWILRD